MKINIEQPLILLLIPAAIALLVFSYRFMHQRSKDLKIKQIILRGLVFCLLIFALSGVSFLQKGTNIATVFIVDASDSTKEHVARITDFVNSAIKTKTSRDYVGVVSVGKNPYVENFVSENVIYHGVQTNVDPSATNLRDAVSLALSLMPDGYARRIVILSDGAENVGNLKDTVSDVTLAGCDVKTYTLPSSTASEVYVSNVTVPDNVGTDEIFKVMVEVESNVSTTAVVSLYQGRKLTDRKTVNLSKGTSLIPFYDTQTDAGLKTYKVTVEAVDDTISLNNEYSAYTNISQKAPILLLEGTLSDAEQLYRMFSSMGIDCKKLPAASAPEAISEMLEYSGIVLCNVSVLDLPKGFMENIASYVKDYGKGLIACGGRNSFALGLYKDTPLEAILPVEMDIDGEAEIPSMAIMFVIDHSGSMGSLGGTGSKLEDAKRALIGSLETLRSEDSVGVIAFDDSYSRVVPLQKLGNDTDDIKNAVGTIEIRGGTNIYPAVEAAANDLSKYDATIKHIILLTDGQDSFNSYNNLILRLKEKNITLSAIAIGDDCNEPLMDQLSRSTGGRMYVVKENNKLPQIFAQEIYFTQNEYLVDRPGPVYLTSSDDIIREVAANGIPDIKAYIATTLKARAIQLFETEDEYPLLSYWQYGLGKTVAWTSDVTGNWSGNFFAWENNTLLWNNLIQLITQKNTADGAYATVTQELSSATVKYHTDDYTAGTTVTAVITDDQGNTNEVPLLPKSPGEFATDFDLTSEGVYSIAIKQSENGIVTSGVTTAAIKKYSPEYTFNTDTGLLTEYTRLVGGTEITSPAQVFTNSIRLVKAMKDITVPILLTALLLFILDIAYRRFRFRILPEGYFSGLITKFKAKKTGKEAVQPSHAGKHDTGDKKEKPSDKEDKGKKPPKAKPPKKNEPDIIDTSMLLNRMKK
ncbi:MAG: VWA domain-containing protein [Lachnospiraceae bacterium]|nr:VWA domain-containing protein [Lachnospiraceae bacterium]